MNVQQIPIVHVQEHVYTVYSFEFAQSYFRLIEFWNWFAESEIRPFSGFVKIFKCIIELTQFWICPQVSWRKGRK